MYTPLRGARVKLQLARPELELLNLGRKNGVVNETRLAAAQQTVDRLEQELKAKVAR